jgi:hypothetical protein
MTSTGSEPRRDTIWTCETCHYRFLGQIGWTEVWCPQCMNYGRGRDNRCTRTEVVEVGSGHDEQTEDWKRKALDYHRALSEGYGVEDGGVWEDRALTAEAELQQVRERTVAAVAQALRGATETRADDDGCMMEMHRFGSWLEVADFIEERFGSSVSGGE